MDLVPTAMAQPPVHRGSEHLCHFRLADPAHHHLRERVRIDDRPALQLSYMIVRIAGIWSDLTAWCGEESHHDDMTVLVLRVPMQ